MINFSKSFKIKRANNNWFVFDGQFGNMMKVTFDVIKIIDQIKKGLTVRQIEIENGINDLTSLLQPLINNNLLSLSAGREELGKIPLNGKSTKSSYKNNPFDNRRPTFRFYISQLCTMKCSYCHMRHSNKQNATDQKLMDWATAKTALDHIFLLVQKNKIRWIRISLYGGEPLTNFRVIKKMLTYIDKRYRTICDIEIILNTNGTVINEDIATFLNYHNIDVHISLDGITHETNQHRILRSGRPSLDRVIKNIDRFMKFGCRVQLDTCLTEQNKTNLNDLIDFAENYSIERIHLALTDTVEHGTKDEDLLAKTVVESYKYARDKNISLFGPWFKIFNSLFIDHSKIGHFGHHLINLIIKPSGYFFIFPYPNNSIGTVDELFEILSLPAYRKISAKWIQEMSFCQGCEIQVACKSYCKSMVMYHTTQKKGFERECSFAKNIIELLMAESNMWKSIISRCDNRSFQA